MQIVFFPIPGISLGIYYVDLKQDEEVPDDYQTRGVYFDLFILTVGFEF